MFKFHPGPLSAAAHLPGGILLQLLVLHATQSCNSPTRSPTVPFALALQAPACL